MIYLSSDGFVDQHNPANEKFGSFNLEKELINIAAKDVKEQKKNLESMLKEHQKNEKQRDDITLIGILYTING